MRSSRVVVTGGAGLVGSHLVDRLVEAGVDHVIVLDNFTRGQRSHLAQALGSGRLTIVEGDIRDRRILAEVMRGVEVVFHQAALRITHCAEAPREALEVLVDGTFNVLDEAARAGVRKIVAASSASVYGLADEFPTSEAHHPYNNRTVYGAAKTFNEALLRAFHEMYDIDYVALRYFNVYGPRMDVHGAYTEVLIRWMAQIEAGQSPLILGDGTQTMDFVYVDDVVRANLLAAEAGVTDDVFNIASGVETSLADLAAALLKAMHSPLQPRYGDARRVNPVPRRLADTRRAESRLRFHAEVPLQDGLRRLVEWWQGHRMPRDTATSAGGAMGNQATG